MKMKLALFGSIALAAWVALPCLTTDAFAQNGPIRRGLRATGQGAAQVVDRAGDVTRRAARGTARAATETVRRTGEATRNVAGAATQGTARAIRRTGNAARNLATGTRGTIRAATPPYNGQYRSGYRGTDGLGLYHQGPSESSSPGLRQGQAYYDQGQLAVQMSNNDTSSHVHPLRHDQWGREFICLNGHRVYFTQQAGHNDDPARDDRSQQSSPGNASEEGQSQPTDQADDPADSKADRDEQLHNQQSQAAYRANKPHLDGDQGQATDAGNRVNADLNVGGQANNPNPNPDFGADPDVDVNLGSKANNPNPDPDVGLID